MTAKKDSAPENRFYPQVRLMLRCITPVAQEACFALKGGTAINLFVREMPRLSVDIDLTYLPIEPREAALQNISQALARISEKIKKSIPGSKVQQTFARGSENRITKLVAALDGQTVTIEPNEVLRGSVFGSEERKLVPIAEKIFKLSTKISTLSINDLYGGKLCAALDRQHPRDLFDVKLLMENEGITDGIRKAFVIYLAGHDRPMHEVIDPTRKDITKIYETDFVDMTDTEVKLDELLKVRETFITQLNKELTDAERRFLLSLKEGNPKWDLMKIPGIDKLPAVQWKLANIQKMKPAKHKEQLNNLKKKLGL